MLVLGKKVLICASHGTVAAGEIADTVLALASLLPNALSVGSHCREEVEGEEEEGEQTSHPSKEEVDPEGWLDEEPRSETTLLQPETTSTLRKRLTQLRADLFLRQHARCVRGAVW